MNTMATKPGGRWPSDSSPHSEVERSTGGAARLSAGGAEEDEAEVEDDDEPGSPAEPESAEEPARSMDVPRFLISRRAVFQSWYVGLNFHTQ